MPPPAGVESRLIEAWTPRAIAVFAQCGSSAAPATHGQVQSGDAIRDANANPRDCKADSMGVLSEIFSWWGGNTWSNRIYTALRGKLVGSDGDGNRYYVQKKGVGPLGVPRRWVIYKTLAEDSQVTPEWHGWLLSMVDTTP